MGGSLQSRFSVGTRVRRIVFSGDESISTPATLPILNCFMERIAAARILLSRGWQDYGRYSMSEEQIVHATPAPRTRESLANDLRQLGVMVGMTIIVHSSMSSLGWVSGGPVAMVQALMDVVTEAGTIVMPTQTGEYSDPAQWENPPVPQAWWQIIRETMPAFDPLITPATFMGRTVEVFRTWPGALRSNHPIVSFAAWGRHAQYITAGHTLEYGLGEGSPLGRIYDLDGWVLLLGVGYDSNTSFHLAEYRAPRAEQ